MSTRGPKPGPLGVVAADGRRSSGGARPKADPDTFPLGNPPRKLPDKQRAYWRAVKREFGRWLRRADRQLVVLLCDHLVRHELAMRAVEEAIDSQDFAAVRPLAVTAENADKAARQILLEIGGSPSSRARVGSNTHRPPAGSGRESEADALRSKYGIG